MFSDGWFNHQLVVSQEPQVWQEFWDAISIPVYIFLMGWVAGRHIEFGFFTIFVFFCHKATKNYNQETLLGTNMSPRMVGKKSFLFHRMRCRGNVWFKSNGFCHMMVGIRVTLTKAFNLHHMIFVWLSATNLTVQELDLKEWSSLKLKNCPSVNFMAASIPWRNEN